MADQTTRFLHRILPLSVQRGMRDREITKGIFDVGAAAMGATLAVGNPTVAKEFLMHSKSVRTYKYGPASRHFVEVIDCENTKHRSPQSDRSCWPTLVFVHGGAWGSGAPWMYRLLARGLERLAARTDLGGWRLCLVGYRVYPQAEVQEQIADVALACEWLAANQATLVSSSDGRLQKATQDDEVRAAAQQAAAAYGSSTGQQESTQHRRQDEERAPPSASAPMYLCGHSSGAHICALWLLQQAMGLCPQSSINFNGFMGLSGVYDIYKHYFYEKSRGVHEVSPMKAANGGELRGFDKFSPSLVSLSLSKQQAATLPPSLIVHGSNDQTVPMSSSTEYSQALSTIGAAQSFFVITQGDHFAPMSALMLEEEGFMDDLILRFYSETKGSQNINVRNKQLNSQPGVWPSSKL